MILHLDSSRIGEKEVSAEARRLHGRYYLSSQGYVLILGSSIKEVPAGLSDAVTSSFVFSSDMQLASKSYHSSLREFTLGGFSVSGSHTWVAAGPCAVESEAQLDSVASALHRMGIRVLRAGCYKPRTSPYCFQGLGKEGLEILGRVAKRYDMLVVTEVRDATHVEEVISVADIVQIGTKAMFDQGILRACAQSDTPVLIKRGFGATLEEFIKAAEFILSGGNTRVILCERGVRSFEPRTRFTLDLCGVAWLKEHINLPIFIDPSHAMGHAYGVADLTRAALAMGVEGLLIEVHPTPKQALSDAAQQLDIAQFEQLYRSLTPFARAVRRTLV